MTNRCRDEYIFLNKNNILRYIMLSFFFLSKAYKRKHKTWINFMISETEWIYLKERNVIKSIIEKIIFNFDFHSEDDRIVKYKFVNWNAEIPSIYTSTMTQRKTMETNLTRTVREKTFQTGIFQNKLNVNYVFRGLWIWLSV